MGDHTRWNGETAQILMDTWLTIFVPVAVIAVVSGLSLRRLEEARRGWAAAVIAVALGAFWHEFLADFLFGGGDTPRMLGLSLWANVGFAAYLIARPSPDRPATAERRS